MLTRSFLPRTISHSQIIISIRTFKRFGEYVKGYGHEPNYYQGGIYSRFRSFSKKVQIYLL